MPCLCTCRVAVWDNKKKLLLVRGTKKKNICQRFYISKKGWRVSVCYYSCFLPTMASLSLLSRSPMDTKSHCTMGTSQLSSQGMMVDSPLSVISQSFFTDVYCLLAILREHLEMQKTWPVQMDELCVNQRSGEHFT